MTTTSLHPRRGPHNPHGGTPARRPGSVRRTTSHDSLRPEGPAGPVQLIATGRDLLTRTDGSTATLGAARIEVGIDYMDGRKVKSISALPPMPGIEALVGLPTFKGFRKALDEALPEQVGSGEVRYQLLDDIPTALLVSGYSLGASGATYDRKTIQASMQFPDLCAGWVDGGTIISSMRSGKRVPLPTGPAAPPIVDPTDPEGWHEFGSLHAHDMRRLRRIDVWLEDGQIVVDAFFRDSHLDPEGRETVVHEYLLVATADPETNVFTSSEASIGALPWLECPGALASAGRIVGVPAGELRSLVRQDFTGPTTCTHLNDTLRALQDVPALAGGLR